MMSSYAIGFFFKSRQCYCTFFLSSRIHPKYCSVLLFFNLFTEQSTAGICDLVYGKRDGVDIIYIYI